MRLCQPSSDEGEIVTCHPTKRDLRHRNEHIARRRFAEARRR
jgi:hypothetical protein